MECLPLALVESIQLVKLFFKSMQLEQINYMKELVQWAGEKNSCMSVPHILNDNHSLPRWLELINIFHSIVTQLIVKYALKPIRLLSGRNVQLLKASLSMQVT